MIFKHTFLSSVIVLGLSISLMAAPAFAQGGDDPVEGIDIIIKRANSQGPVMSGSFGKGQLGKLNSLKPTFPK